MTTAGRGGDASRPSRHRPGGEVPAGRGPARSASRFLLSRSLFLSSPILQVSAVEELGVCPRR